jgi:hypothetical protein
MKPILRSLLCVTALAASACIIEAEHWGTFELEWTIRGRIDPDLCLATDATTLAVDVYEAHGSFVGSYDAPCRAFATSIGLHEGTYSANATLLDPGGYARSTTVSMAPFTVWSDSTTIVPVDFPSSSFY